jgi:hypothetical protein
VHAQKLIIWDLANLSRELLCRDALQLLHQVIENDRRHYPRTVHRVLVVNSPSVLQTVWPTIARWMDEVTLSRVSILGDARSGEARAALLAELADEDLPRYLGGSYDGPTPLGLSLTAPAAHEIRAPSDGSLEPAAGSWRDYARGLFSSE